MDIQRKSIHDRQALICHKKSIPTGAGRALAA